jgi:hypothetical protein
MSTGAAGTGLTSPVMEFITLQIDVWNEFLWSGPVVSCRATP